MHLIGDYLYANGRKFPIVRRSRNGAFLWVAESFGYYVKEHRFLVSDLSNNGHAWELSDTTVFAIDAKTGERVKVLDWRHHSLLVFVSKALAEDWEKRQQEHWKRRRQGTYRKTKL